MLGLGYIGLPTASMFATHGFKVFGVDINQSIVNTLKEGKLHIEEPGLSTIVKAALSSGNLDLSNKPQAADVFIIAVPTPYNHSDSGIPTADLSYVQGALDSILPLLKKGNLVILESTSPPGTTRKLIIPAIEKRGFKIGDDIGVAYCPERVIPGQALRELIGNDRVIGAITQDWAKQTEKLYRSFVSGSIFLTEPTVAEMVKILENTYRDVNIALANEMAVICEKLNINVWEVINLANRHPRVNVHRPGPGVGGHCIGVDPWFLVELFPNEAGLIHKSRNINDHMPFHVMETIQEILGSKTAPKISILGITYKANVDDIRESPALSIINLLRKNRPDATLAIYDPHVKSKDFPAIGIKETFEGSDLILLLSPHDEYKMLDPNEVGGLMRTRILFDAHAALKSEKWIAAGFSVRVLGVGSQQKEKSVSTN